ncbi:AspT/YidE/YbjL antiporter duplication domain-containing protein [Segatella oulorum]|uniref:AspT/YidE/YbjL antiporter duplication domain-containing protein n=1 Tax=Segatella oulorum TaxID=28136 RepID=A0A1T4LQA0_9BACT|nr:putative transporter [Segatella oulorum]SJZ56708.1 AspT/YidE/YbjL antiporter duplication domain-containing protein [Segatella oulorum]
MDWLNNLFNIHSSIQTIVVVSLIIAGGLAFGKIKIMGVSLGISFVFFVGILAGHMGFSVDSVVLDYVETFGLSMFVYCLGLHVGPNFFGSLRHEGMQQNVWSLIIIIAGTLFSLLLIPLTGINLPNMVGILCGATTNTPALGAATQALEHVGLPSGTVALATAVTYPLGVLGVIIAMVILRKCCVKPEHLTPQSNDNHDHTYIAQFEVVNPAVGHKRIADISHMTHLKFIISRIWRNSQVILPTGDTVLEPNDSLLVVTNREDEPAMEMLFGRRVNKDWNKDAIDWNHIDTQLESRILVLTRGELNGKRLGDLHLRNSYNVNVSRVIRGDLKLLATRDLRLQYGDRITVVGQHEDINHVETYFGNSIRVLNEPNIGSIFIGIIVGLAIGIIPIQLPGMESSVRLGIAGGPIIMGIIVGALGPKLKLNSYTTVSASLMLRKLGLSLYLACLGLDAGKHFFSTVVQPQGLIWVGVGFLVTVVPLLVVGLIALRLRKFDFGTLCGILCGSMANPMALGYANDTIQGDSPSISYASVYPLGMFLRVIIAQVLIMFVAS